MSLIPDDLLQRRLDVLGIVQQVSLDAVNALQVTPIFTCGNIAFPASSGKKTVIAYVIVTTSDGIGPVLGTFMALGSNGSNDWIIAGGSSGYNLGQWTSSGIYPIILTPALTQTLGAQSMPVYPPGTVFTVQNNSIVTPQVHTATFTAVGWSY